MASAHKAGHSAGGHHKKAGGLVHHHPKHQVVKANHVKHIKHVTLHHKTHLTKRKR